METILKILILAIVGGLALVVADAVKDKLLGHVKGSPPFKAL